eukprot:TRINITY_DN13040_c0_g1_i1.p1 TRINITY_DN13040_c0_g1~~TRINITY_DN13040_c0_g1_i1.p1  ORF type:complete len:171 (-),score=15.34 TRINITY_DN13040_c0_g1_i1:57-569(-)
MTSHSDAKRSVDLSFGLTQKIRFVYEAMQMSLDDSHRVWGLRRVLLFYARGPCFKGGCRSAIVGRVCGLFLSVADRPRESVSERPLLLCLVVFAESVILVGGIESGVTEDGDEDGDVPDGGEAAGLDVLGVVSLLPGDVALVEVFGLELRLGVLNGLLDSEIQERLLGHC